jgi:hypothetical protein
MRTRPEQPGRRTHPECSANQQRPTAKKKKKKKKQKNPIEKKKYFLPGTDLKHELEH